MDRRAVGGLVLASALTVLVTVPRLLSPPVVDGAARVVPPPPAPAVGTCLAGSVTSSWGAGGRLQPSATVYVDCDRPHRAEVVHVIDPLVTDDLSETVFDQCTRTADVPAYLGATGDDWRPELQMRVTASGPDARQVAAGQNWAACVLVDDVGPTLTGSLSGAAAAHTVPPQVGVCFDGTAIDLAFRGTSSCEGPHGGELFGSRAVTTTTDPVALTASCRALVVADAQRPGIVDDPAVSVLAVVTDDVPADPATGTVPDGAVGTARCVVLAADGHRLGGSVRGLGDGPLPWVD